MSKTKSEPRKPPRRIRQNLVVLATGDVITVTPPEPPPVVRLLEPGPGSFLPAGAKRILRESGR